MLPSCPRCPLFFFFFFFFFFIDCWLPGFVSVMVAAGALGLAVLGVFEGGVCGGGVAGRWDDGDDEYC